MHIFHYTDIKFRELLRICVDQTTFNLIISFINSRTWFSGTTDYFMYYFDYKILNIIQFNCCLMYVDDTFLDDNCIYSLYILNIVAYIDPHIHFTIDTKHLNPFFYLSVLIRRLGGFHFQPYIFSEKALLV